MVKCLQSAQQFVQSKLSHERHKNHASYSQHVCYTDNLQVDRQPSSGQTTFKWTILKGVLLGLPIAEMRNTQFKLELNIVISQYVFHMHQLVHFQTQVVLRTNAIGIVQ